MSTYSRFTEKIILNAGERLFQLKEKLQELRNAEYPSDAAPKLIQIFELLAEHLCEKLISLMKQTVPTNFGEQAQTDGEREMFISIRRIAQFASLLYRWLGVIELAQSKYNPQELISPLEEIVQQIHPNSGLIICPLNEENYVYEEILGNLRKYLRGILESGAEAIFAEYPERFVIISFPNAAKNNVLQHAVFGHELGHLVNDVYEISENVKQAIRDKLDELISRTIEGWLESRVRNGLIKQNEVIKYKAGLNEIINKLLDQWLEEMAADIYACHLWGLASFFANAYYLLTLESLDTWTNRHPSPRFRLRTMLDELRILGYQTLLKDFDELKPVAQELKMWREFIEAKEEEPNFRSEDAEGVMIETEFEGEAYKLAKAIFEDTAPIVTKEMHTRISQIKNIYQSSPKPQEIQDIITLIGLLKEKIPPCEIQNGRKKPYVSISTILNAGWIYRLLNPREIWQWKCPQDIESFFAVRAKEEDKLLLRAIDLSQIFKLFREQEEQE